MNYPVDLIDSKLLFVHDGKIYYKLADETRNKTGKDVVCLTDGSSGIGYQFEGDLKELPFDTVDNIIATYKENVGEKVRFDTIDPGQFFEYDGKLLFRTRREFKHNEFFFVALRIENSDFYFREPIAIDKHKFEGTKVRPVDIDLNALM